eukprot:TRINITY_DN1024_c0_g1_i1.p1 TRINITY_DN1024_c0_g1~~TRINITY_DN1024_c0_g1_i1.p1  ORF type:complete len:639 (+),score=132.40 TRINITY_DN1024_c0_g1_i1:50-1918(+)
MGIRASKCFEPSEPRRFADPWWRKYDKPTDGYVDCSGVCNRLPLRLESTEVIIHGLVDAKKMWSSFEALGEPFQPVLVGDKAVVSIWFNNFIDTDCGGAYIETWYNTFVTPKGEEQLKLPAEAGPMGAIADPKALAYLQRVLCSESPTSTGAGKVAIEGGRAVFGFPKHPKLGTNTFEYKDDKKKVEFNGSHSGKKAVSLNVDIPLEGAEGTLVVPLEVESGPDAFIGAPINGGTSKGHNGSHQTRYASAVKCTQHVKPWDSKTDSLNFGDDEHYAMPIKSWDFEPILKVHSPDFKIAAFKPSGWISGSEAEKRCPKDEKRFTDPWWRKYDKPTDGYVDCSGVCNRLPLRLESTEVIIHGFVDAKSMWSSFEALDEPFQPMLVGDKAVVSIWFNNFTDTDCGGAYIETWYNTFVTSKDEEQLKLPEDTDPMGVIAHPKALVYLQRVLCSESPKSTGAGKVAIEGGRAIFGFPKHPELGTNTFEYKDDNKKVVFSGSHSSKKAVSLDVVIPQEGAEGTITVPLEVESGPDAFIGGPRNGGTHEGHNGAHQSRYASAVKCTQHVKAWDPSTDSLEFGNDEHYAMPIKKWDFKPVLKVHSPDFKVLAHKPSGWISGKDAQKRVKC